jgi:N-terminal acetyltransferase B complex non-catalytic subunit
MVQKFGNQEHNARVNVASNVSPLLSSPLWSELNSIMKEYLKFHEDYMKEATDLTFLAYRHCNYSKVVEFVKHRVRLASRGQTE